MIYRFKRNSPKTFLTIFGKVSINRKLYYSKETRSSFCYLDVKWNMKKKYVTPDVEKLLLLASASMNPSSIATLFEEIYKFSWCKTTIYNTRTEEGNKFNEWSQSPEGQEFRCHMIDVSANTTSFIVGIDGVNMPLREEAKSKRGRPVQRPQLKVPNSQKKSCYKNAYVGSFSCYETLQDINGHLYPNRINSIYNAKMPQDNYIDFKSEFECILKDLEQKLPKNHVKILILDGGLPLWAYIKKEKDRFSEYLKLLDFFHCSEHLSKVAEHLFGKSSTAAQDWFDKWKNKLKNKKGGVNGLIRSIDYYSKKVTSKEKNKLIDQEKKYYKRNKDLMNYEYFVTKGLPIGSGPTEAACKTIVKQRMCQSGMRWDRNLGKGVLSLRTLEQSGNLLPMLDKYQTLEAA